MTVILTTARAVGETWSKQDSQIFAWEQPNLSRVKDTKRCLFLTIRFFFFAKSVVCQPYTFERRDFLRLPATIFDLLQQGHREKSVSQQ